MQSRGPIVVLAAGLFALTAYLLAGAVSAGAIPFEDSYFADDVRMLDPYRPALEGMEIDVLCKSGYASMYGSGLIIQSFVPRRDRLAAVAVGLLAPGDAPGAAVLKILPEDESGYPPTPWERCGWITGRSPRNNSNAGPSSSSPSR